MISERETKEAKRETETENRQETERWTEKQKEGDESCHSYLKEKCED